MATTRKEGAPAKERTSRPSLAATTTQNPRARTTKLLSPAGGSSEKEKSHGKPTPHYLKPTFSSSPDAPAKHAKAAPTTRAPQKSLPIKKVSAEAKTQPQRSSSFTTPRPVRTTTTALSSRSSFSDRMSRGKATAAIRSSLKVAGKPGSGRASAASSAATSTATSAATSTATSPRTTEETMSNEDREAALDILDLEAEEHVLLEIPPAADKAPPDEPIHVEEEAKEPTAIAEHEYVVNPAEVEEGKLEHHDDADGGEEVKEGGAVEEEKGHEEVVTTVEVAETEDAEKPEEKVMVEVSASDVDGAAAVADPNEEGVDGGGERVKLRVSGAEDEAAEKEKRKHAAQQHGKKEASPAYNDVIEETASKLVEKRKSKVLALVGAFETVISLDSGGQGGQ